MVSTVYSVAADCAAFMPNQRIRKLILADLDDSFIEEAKASKLGTLEGYSEVRCIVVSIGCSLRTNQCAHIHMYTYIYIHICMYMYMYMYRYSYTLYILTKIPISSQ